MWPKRRDHRLIVAGREDELHAALGQHVGDGKDHLAPEVQVENSAVQVLCFVEEIECVVDVGDRADHLRTLRPEDPLQIVGKVELVLDDEQAATIQGRHHAAFLWRRERSSGMSIVQRRLASSCSKMVLALRL